MQKHKSMSKKRFDKLTEGRWWDVLRDTYNSVRTVIFTPLHNDRIVHKDVALLMRNVRMPLQPSLDMVERYFTTRRYATDAITTTARERLGIFICLMQFTMYIPNAARYFRADLRDVDILYDAVVEYGRPMDIMTMFDLAMVQTDDDAVEALWMLLVTSRQYARWYDAEAIEGSEGTTRTKASKRMYRWSRSLQACKAHGTVKDQDSAGDVYYIWTHATGKVIFGVLSPWWAIDAHLYRALLHIGTWLNHSIAHQISPQTVKSDHTIAAQYGNMIGRAICRRTTRAR